MIENFSEIILDYEFTVLRLKENNLLCAYDNYLLEIQANSLIIKSLSTEQLCLRVEELDYFKIMRKEKS